MKVLIITIFIVATIQLKVNRECISEATNIVPHLMELYGNVTEKKLTSSGKNLIGIVKQLSIVKDKCTGNDSMEEINDFSQKMGKCLKGGYDLAMDAYKSYTEYEEDGFSDELVDILLEMSDLIEPVIGNCWGDEVKTALSLFLPNDCVNIIDQAAKLAIQTIEQKERPLLVTKGLIHLQKLYVEAKNTCPFLEQLLPKNQDDEEYDEYDQDYSDIDSNEDTLSDDYDESDEI